MRDVSIIRQAVAENDDLSKCGACALTRIGVAKKIAMLKSLVIPMNSLY
jgi:hypothetical protein